MRPDFPLAGRADPVQGPHLLAATRMQAPPVPTDHQCILGRGILPVEPSGIPNGAFVVGGPAGTVGVPDIIPRPVDRELMATNSDPAGLNTGVLDQADQRLNWSTGEDPLV